MKRIFFIIGFNNWGKTYLFRTLFKEKSNFDVKKRRNFNSNVPYPIIEFSKNIMFRVMQVSNDDIDLNGYLDKLEKLTSGKNCENIIVALCPTTIGEDLEKYKDTHGKNDSLIVLKSSLIKGYEKHLIFLEKKWDMRARLEITYIKREYSKKVNFRSEVIKNTERNKRAKEIIDYLKKVYKNNL